MNMAVSIRTAHHCAKRRLFPYFQAGYTADSRDRYGRRAASLSAAANRVWGLLLGFACALVLAGCDSSHAHGVGQPQWQRIGLEGALVHSLAPVVGSGTVYAGTETGIYRSGTKVWTLVLPHRSVWDVTVADGGKEVVAADEGGAVDISHNGGYAWNSRTLTPLGAFAVTIRPSRPRWILGGAGGGIFLSTNGGRSWHMRAALGSNAADAFAWEFGSSRVVLAAIVNGGGAKTVGPVMISRNAGLTWRQFGTNLPVAGVMSLLALPGKHSVAGTMGHAVWLRGPATASWRQMARGMPTVNDHGAGLAAVPGRPPLIYVATLGNGVFRSTQTPESWTPISGGLPSTQGSRIVLCLAYSGYARALLAGTPNGVYELKPATGSIR